MADEARRATAGPVANAKPNPTTPGERPGWRPTPAQVLEAQRFVAEGLPIHPRWLEHLPPALRPRARVARRAA